MRNAMIIALGLGLVVALIFNAGLQSQAQEDRVHTKKLFDLYGDEVTLRLETQDELRWAVAKKNQYWDDAADAETSLLGMLAMRNELQEMLEESRESQEVAERGWELAYYYVFDVEYGMDWLKDEATKAQIRAWFAGDWTDWNDAILAMNKRRDAPLGDKD